MSFTYLCFRSFNDHFLIQDNTPIFCKYQVNVLFPPRSQQKGGATNIAGIQKRPTGAFRPVDLFNS